MKSAVLITLLVVGSALTFSSVNAQPACMTAPENGSCGEGCGDKEKKKEKDTEKKDAFVNCGEKKKGDGTEACVNSCGEGCGDKEKK